MIQNRSEEEKKKNYLDGGEETGERDRVGMTRGNGKK